MKYYAEFYIKHGDTVDVSLGTDQVWRVDGRKTLFGMKMEAVARIRQLRKVKTIYGYKLFRVNNSLREDYAYLTDLIRYEQKGD